jgi:hypothetical protein
VSPLVAALQAALAAEQKIVYGYGVVGARLPADEQPAITEVWDRHRLRRDRLAGLIRSAGGQPVAAHVAYALPFPVRSPAAARRLAGHLENGGAGAAWDLAAASGAGSAERRLAVGWLAEAAVDAATIAGPAWVPAVPGQPG